MTDIDMGLMLEIDLQCHALVSKITGQWTDSKLLQSSLWRPHVPESFQTIASPVAASAGGTNIADLAGIISLGITWVRSWQNRAHMV